MADDSPAQGFHQDPLGFLDESAKTQPHAFWIPGRQLLLAEPDAAKALLRNADGLYQERADFFRLRSGETFGTRPEQLRLGRAARDLLRSHLATHAGSWDALLGERLATTSSWPDAGNWLLFAHLKEVLLAPRRSARLHALLPEIVERAVLAGARARHSAWSRTLFRWRAHRALAREIAAIRRQAATHPAERVEPNEPSAQRIEPHEPHETREPHAQRREPLDLLEVVALEAGPEARASDLAEIYVSFLFASVGSIGFALGWSIYLAGTEPERQVPAAWRVREALRLYPIAWLLGSRPAREHRVAGVDVTPRDEVVACAYLAHRHPEHWDEPERYTPERWTERRRPRGFLPFGWGPHKCPAATLSTDLVSDLLERLLSRYHLRVVAGSSKPYVGAALAPPRFTLDLEPRAPESTTKGGD